MTERIFTPQEVAERWDVSWVFVDNLFRNKPGATIDARYWRDPLKLKAGAVEKAEKRWQKFSGSKFKCHICGFPVRLSLPRYHPLELNHDHILCVKDGGKGGDNLKPAHRICNLKRGVCDVDDGMRRECRERVISEYLNV